MAPPRANRREENLLRQQGFERIAGVDEVGRGCIAGPVMAAAVILRPNVYIPGLRDSKRLSAEQRERLYALIVKRAWAWAVGTSDVAEIDRINIHRASLGAMRAAVLQLTPAPDFVLIDAFRIPALEVPQRGVVGGDLRVAAIAAASIVAKVTRDRLMLALHAEDPRYGFDVHKGYATAAHLAAVATHGYSVVHRRTFRQPTLFDTMSGGA